MRAHVRIPGNPARARDRTRSTADGNAVRTESISGGSLLAAAPVGVIAVALAPLFTARRIRRMDVPSTLRVVE